MAKNLSGELQVASANRLSDGVVVFLDDAGQWTARLDKAALARDERGAEILLERAKAESASVVDPFLVAKAVKVVMRQCPHQTATGKPLVWNEYRVFLDLEDWERIKKLESTLLRDLGGVVEKHLKKRKAEMVSDSRSPNW